VVGPAGCGKLTKKIARLAITIIANNPAAILMILSMMRNLLVILKTSDLIKCLSR
jgi:hypothetical protein